MVWGECWWSPIWFDVVKWVAVEGRVLLMFEKALQNTPGNIAGQFSKLENKLFVRLRRGKQDVCSLSPPRKLKETVM